MLRAHAETYREYMGRIGMFLPEQIEKSIAPASYAGKIVLALSLAALIIGGAFILRAYTVSHLTLWTNAKNVVGLAILPEDGFRMDHRMEGILA